MVSFSSIEARGPEVLCVFEAKVCDCADEQTEDNDRYTEHRDLGWQPMVHLSWRTNQTQHTVQMDLGSPKQRHI